MAEIDIGASSSNGRTNTIKLRKRPATLLLPEYFPRLEIFPRLEKKKEFEIEGRDFFLASKKGIREIMEDSYSFTVDILGDPKQAFFAVIDGHGGHAAADYVAENLGKNIVEALENVGDEIGRLEQAIRRGYLVTDKEFLSQGGFVHCRNGVWRVQGSLAVSRAIGDFHLKQWIISEPEIKTLPLTSDCEFLIMASDGLWDKVNEQEAVNVVLRERNVQESCKKLVDISCGRGNIDDITVMVVNLENFAL
ncbi:probable protein phosphatase 2C 30 isoform X2 [Durio zibethinus]|uniref:Probable protein phosphatase 2C 30 isoform X2 n=1 Tax=Durio zibethinus TaxID=66656 RepID=A0A6P5WQI6_DURZI|nr:probable protein phosphatase 2C 30 isoform X2 [Durio zibethinus]